jgi:hypothetical protein
MLVVIGSSLTFQSASKKFVCVWLVPAIYQSLAQIVVRFRRRKGAAEDVVFVIGILKGEQRNLTFDLGGSRNVVVQTRKNDAVNIPF